MTVKEKRHQAILKSIDRIKSALSGGVDVPGLERAKTVMLELAAKRELFPQNDFPLPIDGEIFRTFLIHQEQNGDYALYVNSSQPGQQSLPHDHGGAWAIVVAVDGEEKHRVYRANPNLDEREQKPIEQAGEIIVKPGNGISLLPDGIHSIHAESRLPLLHLHLYAKGFAHQGQRREFDLDTGKVNRFVLEDLGFIEDARQ